MTRRAWLWLLAGMRTGCGGLDNHSSGMPWTEIRYVSLAGPRLKSSTGSSRLPPGVTDGFIKSVNAPIQPRFGLRRIWFGSMRLPSGRKNTSSVSGRLLPGWVGSVLDATSPATIAWVVRACPARSRRSQASPMRTFSPGSQTCGLSGGMRRSSMKVPFRLFRSWIR